MKPRFKYYYWDAYKQGGLQCHFIPNPIVIGLSLFILHNLQIDWCTKSLHFDVPQKVTSKCEKPTSKNITSKGKDYHLDELCIKFLECEKYLGSAQDVKSLKALFVGTKAFVQAAKKRNAFLIYVFPHQMLNCLIMRFLPNTRNLRTCLKRRMLTPYQNIVHMIAPLTSKREHTRHIGQSTTCHKMNYNSL